MDSHSICSICGKHRNIGNHKKCSRLRQKMYAPGTALKVAQEAEMEGRRKSVIYRPLDLPVQPKAAMFSRFRKEGY